MLVTTRTSVRNQHYVYYKTICCLLASLCDHYTLCISLCCGPAEIGQQYTIKSTAIVPSDARITWQLDGMTTLYESSLKNESVFPTLYVGTRTRLTILSVTKNDGQESFQHYVNYARVYSCTLPVYKRATTPICEPVTLIGNQLRTKCTTAQVYPQAKCHFTLQNGEIDRRTITEGASYIAYAHNDPQSGGNEYISTSCTLEYPVNGLKPGNWTVQVNMFPDLTGVSLAQGTTGKADNTLMLSVPTPHIDSNVCPIGLDGEGDTNVKNGIIRRGERASCLCVRTHPGNPPGTIGWSSAQGKNFVLLSQTADAVSILINSPDTFTCHSMTVLDGSHSMTYTPRYAYGPDEVTISVADDELRQVSNEPLDLCSSEGLDFTIICAVNHTDVRPNLTIDDFKVVKPNTITIQQTYLNTSGGGNYKSVNKLKVTSGGSHMLVCDARNSMFPDIKQRQSMTIEVREPPSNPPKISARSRQNGDILVVGDDVTVTCSVSGGYPSVQSVTLSCGQNQSVTSNGTSTQLTLNKIEQTCNVINCTCQATHVTGCYDLMGILPLNVLCINPHKSEENLHVFTTSELVGGIIGTIVGILVVEAVIAMIVFFIRREKGRRKKSTEDKEYDKIKRQPPLPYQNVKPRDSNYQTIHPSEQASNNATTDQETERTYKNQAFGEYEEPIEPDPNAYSDIQVE